jgi:flagellar motor switch protein FliN/FliY
MADNDELEYEELTEEGQTPPPEPAAEVDEKPVLDSENGDGEAARTANDLAAVYDIPVNVSAVLGKSTMQVSSLLKLGRGAVLELDRKVGEAIDIYVNNRLVARGEVVVVEERLGVTMTEIIKTGDSG